MKNLLASLLLAGLSTLPANAILDEDIVILTSDDIERRRSPVFFAVHRVGDTGFSFDFGLTKSSGLMRDLAPYQLCVLNQAVDPVDLPAQLSQTDLIVRTQMGREERATFDLRKEEIPNSALMVYLATGASSGTRHVRGFCLPFAELMKTVRLTERHRLTGRDTSLVA